MTKQQQRKMTHTTSSKQLNHRPKNIPFDSPLSLLAKKNHIKNNPTNPTNPNAASGILVNQKKAKSKAQKINNHQTPYSPNALITSNRIPAKADLQSPSQAALRLRSPLLFPAYFRRSRVFESAPAVFGQLVEDV
jgi:hypothetical protein